MFYCKVCAIANEWPDTMGKSEGRCEMCGKTAVCNDRPSSHLPVQNAYQVGTLLWIERKRYLTLRQILANVLYDDSYSTLNAKSDLEAFDTDSVSS